MLLVFAFLVPAGVSVADTGTENSFKEAVLTRCLPAVLTNNRVPTKGLKRLTRAQKTTFLGGSTAPAYWVGKRVILTVPKRAACQVGAYAVPETALGDFPEQWLVGSGAPFKELSQRPNKNTRVFTGPGGVSVVFEQRPAVTLFSALRGR